MKVRSIRSRGLSIPVPHPVETAIGVIDTVPVAVVDVLTDEGVVGRSYVRTYSPYLLGSLLRLLVDVEDLLRGCSADPAAAGSLLRSKFRLDGTRGVVGMALAAVDMSLWDARARAREIPLVTLLGGRPTALPAYAALRSMDKDALLREVEAHLRLGFEAFKVKLGGSTFDRDLEVVRTLRSAVGPTAEILVDYNQSLPVDDALERVSRLDQETIGWIEEPTEADDNAGHAAIAAAAETPIQLGENWWGSADVARAIAAGASDHAMFDAMRIGGVTGWLEAMVQAERAAMPVSSHAFIEVSAHLLAVTPTRHYLEYIDHVGPVIAQPLEVRNGRVEVPDRPGNGIEWDETAIARLT